jgi:hypothetical protein
MTNNKNYHHHDHQRTFNNNSPSNKQKNTSGSQRPSPSKSINIRTPNKNSTNGSVAGYNKNNYLNNSNSSNNSRLSLSGSPTTSFFAASKCFESPSADSLPRPPANWMTGDTKITELSTTTPSSTTKKTQNNRARKALVMPTPANDGRFYNSCAFEYAAAFSANDTNDHFTQSLKLLLNVNA